MYGMMPSAKIVIFDRFCPENMSYRPNIVFSGLVGQKRQRLRIHTGHDDVIADAVHGQHEQREEHAVSELADLKDISEAFNHSCAL